MINQLNFGLPETAQYITNRRQVNYFVQYIEIIMIVNILFLDQRSAKIVSHNGHRPLLLVASGASQPPPQCSTLSSIPGMLLPMCSSSHHDQVGRHVASWVAVPVMYLFMTQEPSVVEILPQLAMKEHFIGSGAWQSEKKIAIPMPMVGNHIPRRFHTSVCLPLLCLKFGKIIRHQSNP